MQGRGNGIPVGKQESWCKKFEAYQNSQSFVTCISKKITPDYSEGNCAEILSKFNYSKEQCRKENKIRNIREMGNEWL
jgi:hypothetical protein